MSSRPSLPLETVVTSNPSTSSKVCRYLRMLGSSSMTRIFSFGITSFVGPFLASRIAVRFHLCRQQELERASPPGLAVHPDLSMVRLNQSFRYCQSQTHS